MHYDTCQKRPTGDSYQITQEDACQHESPIWTKQTTFLLQNQKSVDCEVNYQILPRNFPRQTCLEHRNGTKTILCFRVILKIIMALLLGNPGDQLPILGTYGHCPWRLCGSLLHKHCKIKLVKTLQSFQGWMNSWCCPTTTFYHKTEEALSKGTTSAPVRIFRHVSRQN